MDGGGCGGGGCGCIGGGGNVGGGGSAGVGAGGGGYAVTGDGKKWPCVCGIGTGLNTELVLDTSACWIRGVPS